MEADNILLII